MEERFCVKCNNVMGMDGGTVSFFTCSPILHICYGHQKTKKIALGWRFEAFSRRGAGDEIPIYPNFKVFVLFFLEPWRLTDSILAITLSIFLNKRRISFPWTPIYSTGFHRSFHRPSSFIHSLRRGEKEKAISQPRCCKCRSSHWKERRQTLLWYLSSHKMNKNRNTTTRFPYRKRTTNTRKKVDKLASPTPFPLLHPLFPLLFPLLFHLL